MTDLHSLRFSLPLGVADAVASLLIEECVGVQQIDAETEPTLGEAAQLVVWLEQERIEEVVEKVETLLTSLEKMGQTISPWSYDSEAVRPEDWQEAYKEHFKVNRIGRFVVVKPTWEECEPNSQDLVVEIDPGMAFGTGLHASTKLVVHAIERLAHNHPAPRSVLDLGCGSGILAIAAAKLWPGAAILAIDNDPTAVEVCLKNVKLNGLADRIEVEQRSGADLAGNYSLVMANLTYEVLQTLRPELRQHLEPYGHLILSGLLADQAKEVAVNYCSDLQLEPEFSEEIDGWRSYLLEVRE